MANLRKVIYINEKDYSTLINGDSLVIDGTTYTYEENALYVIKNAGPPEYAETAGYATNAGTSQVAVSDASGNNIAATYEKKPLIIEVNESDSGTTLEQGTYDSITQALALNRLVILKLTRDNDDNEILYLPLLIDYTVTDNIYLFIVWYNTHTSYKAEINNRDEFYYVTNTLVEDDVVVHKAETETITGNKTFTGTVSLGSKATATTPATTDNDTSVATTAFVHNVVNTIPEITTGQIVGRMHRDNVSGTGNLTITGASGEGFSPTGITTAGKYIVVVYSWSDTKTFGYNISFGSNNYTLSTTDGTISDKRELTVSAGALWSGTVTTAVSAGTTIIVEIYKVEKTTQALSVGTVALTNLYNDLDGKPTISSSTSSSSTTDIASSKAVKLAYDHGGVQSVNGQTGAVSLSLGDTNIIETVKVNGTALTPDANKAVDITSIPANILTGTIPNNVTATTQNQNDNSTKIATTAYVDTAIDNIPDPMIFKGSLGTGGTITALPTAAASNEGYTYKVITNGTYGGQSAKVGDTFISDGTLWIYIPSGDEPSGTVISVGAQGVSGSHISVTNSPITTSGTLSIGIESGYSIPSVANQTTWSNAIRGLIIDKLSSPGTEATSLTPDNNKNVTLYLDDIFGYNNKLLLLNANGDAIDYITVALDAIDEVTSDQALITGGYLHQVLPSTTLSNNYAPSTNTNENLILAAGDTYEEAFSKLEKTINDNEEITAAALTDLDERIPVIDQELSETSENPVQNKVITQAIIDNEYVVSTALNNINDRLENKQDTLISGTNIKTINNLSLLGTGNINISNIEIIEVNANIRADVTKDGTITVDDTTAIAKNLNTTNLQYDLNNDGLVTISDVSLSSNIAVNKPHNLYIDIETNPYSLITTSFNNSKIPILRLVFPGNLIKDILIQKTNNTPVYYGEDIYAIQIPSSGNGINLSETILKIFVQISETEANGIIGHIVTKEGLATKQDTLVSGTNIKTINNQSLLGEGNITIEGGSGSGGGDTNVIETVKVNGTALTPDANKAVDITVPTTLDSISDGNTRKLSDYLPLSGGTMTGAITVAPGDGKGLLFSTTSNINVSGTTNTILGFYNGTYIIGHTAYPVNIRGTNTRPNYNGNQLALYSDIPSEITESTVSGWGFTKNTGTVTGVKMNGTTNNPTNGVVDLGTVLTSFTETDPTVPAWAKAASKPTYTAAEVGALPDTYTPPVTSVNGQTGAVNLTIPAAPGTLNTTATTAQSTSSSEALSGNITLHKVAKTGTYNDLIGKPTIPAAQVQSDWNATSGMGVILNKPTIPTVNNATLTIQKNGTTVNTFTANASSNVTANIQVNELPTVSSSDNGKILQVVNGAWSLVTPVTVYTGTSAPNSSLGINGDLYVLTS